MFLRFGESIFYRAFARTRAFRSRCQKTLAVNLPYRGSKGPLHLRIDSTDIKVEDEGEWRAPKHGSPKRRVWCTIHLGVDGETLEIKAVGISRSHVGDAPVLPDLLGQIPADQEIGSVTADNAKDTRKCHDAIADHGTEERQAVADLHRWCCSAK